MILSLVSELLARVGRQPAVEEALEALRRSGGEVRLAGLTDSAKALLVALAQAELGRPAVFLVETNQRTGSSIASARLRASPGTAWCIFHLTKCSPTKTARRTEKFPRTARWRCGDSRAARRTC